MAPGKETPADTSLPRARDDEVDFDARFGEAGEAVQRGAQLGMGVAMASLKQRLFGRKELPSLGERYELRRVAGRGGLGVVYEAFDRELERPVAVKLVRPSRASEAASERLVREAKLLARVEHPHVVRVYDAGRLPAGEGDAPEVFVVMEMLAGETLAAWLEQERDWETVLDRFLEAGQGLHAAHEAGVVHRDFKPDNVIIDKSGRARVVDFGLAFASLGGLTEGSDEPPPASDARASGRLTQEGTVMGTPDYMAPEQRNDSTKADARSDQFAFCLSLAEALGIERPEAEPAPSRGAPAAVTRVILRGVSTDPQQRWPDMATLLAQLAVARGGPTRRRWAIAGVATLALVGAAAWFGGQRHAVDCSAGEAELASVWGAPQRSSVREALEGLDLSWAQWTREHVEADLDDYARRWLDARERQCRAPRGGETEIRARCLGDALIALDSTVKLLTEADERVAREAARIITELPPVEACTDQTVEQLMTVAGREDPSGELGVSEKLRRLQSLRSGGKYEAARAQGEELVAWAEGQGLPGTRAAVLHEMGLVAQRQKDYPKARALLEEAYGIALAAGVDSLVTRIAVARVSGALEDEDERQALVERAEAWLDRTNAPVALRAGFNNQRGVGLLNQRKFAAAREAFELAVSQYGSDPKVPPLHVLAPKNNLAILPLMAGEPVGEPELAALAAIAAQRGQLLGPEHPLTLSARVNLATTRLGVGEVHKAREELAQLHALLAGEASSLDAFASAVSINLAQCELGLGHPGRALEVLDADYARFVSREGGPSKVRNGGLVALIVGRAHAEKGDFDAARRVFDALEATIEHADEQTRKLIGEPLAYVWTQRAWAELLADDPATARHFAERSLAQEANPLAGGRRASTHFALGVALVRQGQLEPARLELRAAAQIDLQMLGLDRAGLIANAVSRAFAETTDAPALAQLQASLADRDAALAGADLEAWQAKLRVVSGL